MTIDKSLRVKAGSVKDRNVLNRAERMAQCIAQGTWTAESTVLGMAKTRVKKITMKKKKKVKAAEEEPKKK
ncbi:MAG: small basic protein [Planctomycetaceae bacterium]|nr:small basic protein [Planctomycetaceae bacterium]